MKQFAAFLSTLVIFLATPILLAPILSGFAQTPCVTIYGGGVKSDGTPFCISDIQKTTEKTPLEQAMEKARGIPTTSVPGTKGGLSVQPAPTVQKIPATGPEDRKSVV